ncbi:AAA family ATPase [Spirillospora sp. CA-255316]
MGPGDVTSRAAVLKAMEEYDQLGQETFLGKYKFQKSRKFVVHYNDRDYDSKALLAAAHGFQYPDKGPLPNKFSGGEQTTGRFRAMGFQIRSPRETPIDINFTVEDCQLFEKYPAPVPWREQNVPLADQQHFKDIRARLKRVAEWLSVNVQVDLDTKPFTSMYQANAQTQNDVWCCIFPAEVSNKSYALQVALIVSARGAEVCLCLGAGRSQLKNPTAEEKAFELLQSRLAATPDSVVSELSRSLPAEAKFRKSWRVSPSAGEFSSLREWLQHAASPSGAQASVSIYLTPEQLSQTRVTDSLLEMANASASLFEYCYLGEVPAVNPAGAFDVAALQRAAAEAPTSLALDEKVHRAIIAAINSGKHVILTGPPGTAKTTLAEMVGQLAHDAQRCSGYTLTTATADWTTYETIGGLRPSKEKGLLEFKDGLFLEAIRKNRWLVIDELNRSNFDRAFGQLFTVLSKQAVVLPYEDTSGRPIALVPEGASGQYRPDSYDIVRVPRTWRIIATMNVFDKSLLFEMSYALMRRFAFIEVPPPPRQIFAELWRKELGYPDAPNSEAIDRTLDSLYEVAVTKEIGPATFKDMARFAIEYTGDAQLADSERKQLAFQLFYTYLLPQFEGITLQEGKRLFSKVLKLVGEEHQSRLRTTLSRVLGLDFSAISLLNLGSSDDENELAP